MKPVADLHDKIDESDAPAERGYAAWKRAKVERGLAQTKDRAAIRDWIAEDNERAADQVIARIVQTAMMFGQFPMLGRAGQVDGTREFSVVGLPYLIVYRIESETELDVLTVLHTRRKYPG